MNVDRESLVDLVHGALSHLYDHAYLRNHPLAQPLAPEGTPDARGRALRRLLLHAIQDLKPPPEAPLDSPGWRHYQYLYLRYVEAKPVAQIAGGLAVSERQTRRRHRDALDALARVVWDQWRTLARVSDETVGRAATQAPEDSASPLDAELNRIDAGPPGAANVVEVIDGAIAITRRLGEQRAVSVEFVDRPVTPLVVGNRVILRQAVVGVLVYATQHAAGGRILVSVTSSDERLKIGVRFRALGRVDTTTGEGKLGDVEKLLRPHWGELALRVESNDRVIDLSLPIARPRSILVVDDNPDMCQLYRRYLGRSGYQVIEAHSGDAAFELLGQATPAGIVLDVMLPVRDGWEILQTLRGQTNAQEIPVLVCSVLQQRELALSLGATDFLAKPITQQALLEALDRLCDQSSGMR